MYRKAYQNLLQWKNEEKGRCAIMLDGARRVGKSYIAERFAKNEYNTLKQRRKKYELEQYKFLINLYVPQSELNQRFFEEFCQKLKLIKEKNKDISENIISDLKERWSTFILKNNINLFMNDSIHPDVTGQLYRVYERIVT